MRGIPEYATEPAIPDFMGILSSPPVELTVEYVDDIHHEGGTILASSRGGFDIEVIMNFLTENKVDQLYVIGGDGTHRGANFPFEKIIHVANAVHP